MNLDNLFNFLYNVSIYICVIDFHYIQRTNIDSK